jgi:sugar/nucleoside kinase (ribokinase family)
MTIKSYDVIVVGELNVDLILNNLDSFPEIGKEKLAQNMNLSLGSSSAIFACNLSSLGANVAFIGKIGNDYLGRFVMDKLHDKGVDVKYILKDQNLNTGATIVLNYNEDRAMVTYPGAMNNLTINDISEETLALGKHLHFSSFYLQPGLKKDIGKMFKLAKDLNMTTSFDMQWDPEEKWELNYKEVLPFVDVFLPNEKELLNLTKESSVTEAFNKLSGSANSIVVKMGSRGSLLYSEGKTNFRQPFLNTEVIDAIGAGDSFNAGFIFKFINHADLNECQEFGNLMGAINTTAAGGTTAFTNYEHIMKIAEETFRYKPE